MERENLKYSLIGIGYSTHSIKSILSGRRKVTLDKAIEIKKEFGIPVEAWVDVKTYLEQKD